MAQLSRREVLEDAIIDACGRIESSPEDTNYVLAQTSKIKEWTQELTQLSKSENVGKPWD